MQKQKGVFIQLVRRPKFFKIEKPALTFGTMVLRLGSPTPVFIPFIGAIIQFEPPVNRDDEALIGYSGPLLGTIAALVVFGVYLLLPRGSQLSSALFTSSYFMIFINLINLFPISLFDGGRVTQAIASWLKYVGLVALLVVTVMYFRLFLIIIWLMVARDYQYSRARERMDGCTRHLPRKQLRVVWLIRYLGLAIVLFTTFFVQRRILFNGTH